MYLHLNRIIDIKELGLSLYFLVKLHSITLSLRKNKINNIKWMDISKIVLLNYFYIRFGKNKIK